MKSVYICITTESFFIGAYTTQEIANDVKHRLGGEYMGDEILVEEHTLDNMNLFSLIGV